MKNRMKIPQYSPGSWLGAYYTQLQYTASYMTFVNFAMIATNLWLVAQEPLTKYVSWLTFPIFATISLLLLFIVIPFMDYVFMLRSRIIYQNKQACKHDNPVMEELEEIKHNLKKHMGKEYETLASH